MSVVADAEQATNQKTENVTGLETEIAPNCLFVADGNFGDINNFSLPTKNLSFLNRQGLKQELVSESEIASFRHRRNIAFVSKEEVDTTPINDLCPLWVNQRFIKRPRRLTAGQCDRRSVFF